MNMNIFKLSGAELIVGFCMLFGVGCAKFCQFSTKVADAVATFMDKNPEHKREGLWLAISKTPIFVTFVVSALLTSQLLIGAVGWAVNLFTSFHLIIGGFRLPWLLISPVAVILLPFFLRLTHVSCQRMSNDK